MIFEKIYGNKTCRTYTSLNLKDIPTVTFKCKKLNKDGIEFIFECNYLINSQDFKVLKCGDLLFDVILMNKQLIDSPSQYNIMEEDFYTNNTWNCLLICKSKDKIFSSTKLASK
jgi:hypothetical protein